MHEQNSLSPGFTIVELLIVIVVIAILAAISTVAYRGLQDRARASEVSSALSQAKKKLELYKVDQGTYPTSGNLASAGVTSSDGSFQYTSDGSAFCLTATSGSVSYTATNTTTPTQGGCPGHGQGGTSAITNLAINPSVETGGSLWAARWFGGSGGSGTTALSTSAAFSGSSGYRKTWSTAGGGNDVGFSYTQTGITAGSTYIFSGYIRSSVSTLGSAWVHWQDASGTEVGSRTNGSSGNVSANAWQRLSVTGTAPAGAVQALFVWGTASSGSPNTLAGQTMDFDGVMITEGSTLHPYADGGSSNWIWNGTANNSTSTGPSL